MVNKAQAGSGEKAMSPPVTGLRAAIEAVVGPVSRSVRERNPAIFGAAQDTRQPAPRSGARRQREADLQRDCERWLEAHGYMRRTSPNIQRTAGRRWFAHFPRTKGNPIMPDLILLNGETGHYLEVELKVPGGQVSPDQQAMIHRREWKLCWSFEDFMTTVQVWEASIGGRHDRRKRACRAKTGCKFRCTNGHMMVIGCSW